MVLKPPPTPVRPAFAAATLVGLIRGALWSLPDSRKGGNNQRYAMGDAGLSAFSVFFLQSPSFLEYQRRMQKERGRNNAGSFVWRAPDSEHPSDLQPARPGRAGASGAGFCRPRRGAGGSRRASRAPRCASRRI